MNPLFTKKEFLNKPSEFKLGAIISDGMWYSQPKWRKLARVTEEEIEEFIERNIELGNLIQSDNNDKSYRFTLEAINKWHEDNGIELSDQIIDSLFPASDRIWDGMTEVEGFLKSPKREFGSVAFNCSPKPALEIIEALKGVARVREDAPGHYRAYGLSATYIKNIIEGILQTYPEHSWSKVYARHIVERREMIDFPKKFREGLIVFYKRFGRSLIQNRMSTISMFLPDKEDQEAQIIEWIIEALEKFDERVAVPFSGYLHSALKHWPMNIPEKVLGKDLALFQNNKNKAIQLLVKKFDRDSFTSEEIATEMGLKISDYQELEDNYRVWSKLKNSTSLIWDESSEEKEGVNATVLGASETDIALSNKISSSVIKSAIETELFDDAFRIIDEIDTNDINLNKLNSVSDDFVRELGYHLGLGD